MGIPRADGEHLYELTELMHTNDDAVAPPERRAAAMIEMLNYADQVSQAKREKPSDDIASTLVQAEIDGDRLTDAELNWFFLLLVNAGGDTTRNLVAAGVQLLFDNPDRARPAAGRPRHPLADGGRRDAAVHLSGRALPSYRDGRHGDPRPTDRGRRQDHGVLRLGEP